MTQTLWIVYTWLLLLLLVLSHRSVGAPPKLFRRENAAVDSNSDSTNRDSLYPFNMQLKPDTDERDSHPDDPSTKQEMQRRLDKLSFALRSISDEMTALRTNLKQSNDESGGAAGPGTNELMRNIEKWAGLDPASLKQADKPSFEEFFVRTRDEKDGRFKPAENLSRGELKHAQGQVAELIKELEKRDARLSPK